MLVPNDNAIALERLLAHKSALFVGAHPDDIEFRAGGLVHLMRQHGTEITFAIATRGGKGLPRALRGRLERTRVRQQDRAATLLGGMRVVFYGYPDGNLPAFVKPFTDDLRALIADTKPEIVSCWDPEFIFTPHPDHKAAADATQAAIGDVNTCWYGTTKPNLWVGLDKEVLRTKVRALKAHKTETPWFYFDMRLKRRMITAMRIEGAKVGSDYAETFRLSGKP